MVRYLILGVLWLSSLCAHEDPVHEYIETGIENMESGNYYRALQEFSSAILMMEWTGNFSHMSAYIARGDIYFILDDYESAIANYSAVVNSAHSTLKQVVRALGSRCFSYGFLGYVDACNNDFNIIRGISEECTDFLDTLQVIQSGIYDDDDDEDYDDDEDDFMSPRFLVSLKGRKV